MWYSNTLTLWLLCKYWLTLQFNLPNALARQASGNVSLLDSAESVIPRIVGTVVASQMLQIGVNRIRKMAKNGEIRALPGRNIRIPLVAIDEFIATANQNK